VYTSYDLYYGLWNRPRTEPTYVVPGHSTRGVKERAQGCNAINQGLKLKALEEFLKNRATLILDDSTAPLDLLKSQKPAAGKK
jgi:hypothetical protein